MNLIDRYIHYVRDIRRYSPRTVSTYEDSLKSFSAFVFKDQACSDRACLDQASLDQEGLDRACSDEVLLSALNPSEIRGYEVHLLDVAGNGSLRTGYATLLQAGKQLLLRFDVFLRNDL